MIERTCSFEFIKTLRHLPFIPCITKMRGVKKIDRENFLLKIFVDKFFVTTFRIV